MTSRIILDQLNCDDRCFELMETILHVYLDPVYWSLPAFCYGDSTMNTSSAFMIRNNVLQVGIISVNWCDLIFSYRCSFHFIYFYLRSEIRSIKFNKFYEFQICLLAEGIGNMAVCLKKIYSPLLRHCLYSIIERAGCSNEFISAAGEPSLAEIFIIVFIDFFLFSFVV